MHIGFSTGSLAYSDFRRAIAILKGTKADVIELSALREGELDALIDALGTLDLQQYKYVSFHAPSKLINISEEELLEKLLRIVHLKLPIIVHPDIIRVYENWHCLGEYLCIENMDKRKPVGRTTADLEMIFKMLPQATFCFDLAHARQVDPTMTEAMIMAKRFSRRLTQLHVSDVNSMSQHEPLNIEAMLSFRKVAKYLDPNTPIVLESIVTTEEINQEIDFASYLFNQSSFESLIQTYGMQISPQTNRISLAKA